MWGSILRSPLIWFGGKGRFVPKLLPLIPPHSKYVEVFGGGGSLLFAKEPAAVEVYNDINAGLANFFRVIQDPVLFADFCRRINFTLYSRAEYEHFRKTWETIEDPLERAFRFYVVARQSFGGMFGKSWGYALTLENGGMSAVNSKWLSIMRMMPEIQKRLATVKIECRSWREVLRDYAAKRDRALPRRTTAAFFVSEKGTRVSQWAAGYTFVKVSGQIGLRPPIRGHRYGHGPRLHDLRHRFAARTLVDWYRSGVDVERELPRLATYLGHVHVNETYWYLEAVPELLELATQRLLGGRKESER